MRTADYPSLGERFYEETIRGLRVRVIPKPGFFKTYAFLAVDYGAIDTQYMQGETRCTTPDGIAHYLEHKMFDMPYGDAMNRFAAFGGSPNAFTSHTMTAYYFECTEHFEENLKTLTEFVFTPYFTQKSVDKEREIITQEIRMYEDSAGSRIYENLFRALYRTHPIRVPIAGTAESIRAITPSLLEQCHRAFYTPQNAILCVMGDVRAESVFSAVDASLPAVAPSDARKLLFSDGDTCADETNALQQMEISRPMFLTGFKCRAPKPGKDAMRAEFIGDLAAELMLGESTPFYQTLYNEGLIDESFSAGYESVKGAAIFTAGGDSDQPQAVSERIVREAERVAREGFDPSFYQTIKKAMLGRKVRALDSFELCCASSCEYALSGAEFFEFPEVFGAITASDVQAFIAQALREDAAALSVILPREGSGIVK